MEVSETSVRHHTEIAGAAHVAVKAGNSCGWNVSLPAGPVGPEVLQVVLISAMVPLVGGEWAEVKTAAVGRVEVEPNRDGVPEAHARNLRYFSRLADVERFTRRYGRTTRGRDRLCQDGVWGNGRC